MKREGRQHGMVKTHCILPFSSADIIFPKKTSSKVKASAGIFTRAPSKPTNHSKFTGKCRHPRCSSCHLNPRSKSKGSFKQADLGCGELSLKLDGHSSVTVLDELHNYTSSLHNHGIEEDED